MSLRYRKVVRVGKFARINLTKTGVGVSAGIPGARISAHSSGRVTTSVGAPGTGLYMRKDRVARKGVHIPATDGEWMNRATIREIKEAVGELTEADYAAMTEEDACAAGKLLGRALATEQTRNEWRSIFKWTFWIMLIPTLLTVWSIATQTHG